MQLADAAQADAPYAPAEDPEGRVLLADGTFHIESADGVAMNCPCTR